MRRKLKPYPKYKDSGVEWLGEVPEGWEVVSIKHIGRIRYGIGEPPEYQLEGTPLIRATNVHAGKIIEERMVYVCLNDIPSQRIVCLQEGDIIIVRSGAYTGDSARVPAKYAKCIAGFDMVLSCSQADSEFVQFALLSKYLKDDQIDLEKMRAAQPHLNSEELGSCLFVSPPIQEQISISSFLDRETTKIDSLIAKQNRLIDLLKEKRSTLISHAVTKGLDPSVKMKDSGVEWLGEVPEVWKVKRLKHLSKIQTGDKDTVNAVDGGTYPFFVRSQSIERIDSFTFDCEAILTAGDGVGVGKVFHHYIGPFDFHQRVYMLNKFQNVIGRFLFYFLKEQFHRVALDGNSKSTVDSLRMPLFLNFPIALPPIEEQLAISSFLDRETAKIDSLIAKAHRAIELLQEHRTSLISAAVTGKIDLQEVIPSGSEKREIAHE